MMPMQMRRKARKIEKVENLSRTATAQNVVQHAGTNQITLARFGGRIFSRAAAPVRARSAGCHGVGETRAGRRSRACSIRPVAGQPRQVSVPDVGATAGPNGIDFAGYESFRRRTS